MGINWSLCCFFRPVQPDILSTIHEVYNVLKEMLLSRNSEEESAGRQNICDFIFSQALLTLVGMASEGREEAGPIQTLPLQDMLSVLK